MFVAKNVTLARRLGRPIRGRNREATLAIAFFAIFILLSIWLAQSGSNWGRFPLLPDRAALLVGLVLLAANLLVATASLWDLGDSWRVGVLEEQQTTLVESGIYRFSRNPYFVAYGLMFAAYTLLLQSAILLVLTTVGFALIQRWYSGRKNTWQRCTPAPISSTASVYPDTFLR